MLIKRIIIAAALMLTACDKGGPQEDVHIPAGQAPAAAPAPEGDDNMPDPQPFDAAQGEDLNGPFAPASANARALGPFAWNAEMVAFGGARIGASALDSAAATDALSERGRSYDDLAPGADDRVVDLRRVSGASPPLCGAAKPVSYLAIVHDDPAAHVAVIAFTGSDQPGPEADDGEACAVYTYQAPPEPD